MLVIRLFRVGKKNQPSFKIVVTDKRRPPRGGRYLEQVGFYNPLTKEKVLKGERFQYWLSKGAKPSDTVYNLLVAEKIIEGKKIPQHKKSKKEEKVSAEQPTGETGKEKIPKKEAPEKKVTEEAPKEEAPKETAEEKKETTD